MGILVRTSVPAMLPGKKQSKIKRPYGPYSTTLIKRQPLTEMNGPVNYAGPDMDGDEQCGSGKMMPKRRGRKTRRMPQESIPDPTMAISEYDKAKKRGY